MDVDTCPDDVAPAPNWEAFYRTLVRLGPLALEGIPKGWVRWFQVEGAAADWFWSESIPNVLELYWDAGPEVAVRQAMTSYAESVQLALRELPVQASDGGWLNGPASMEPMSWEDCVARVRCDEVRPRILRALVRAAKQPSREET